MEPSAALIEAVAVTAELCGRVFSEPAARVFVQDLSGYDEAQVIDALRRCRREVRGILTVQDVVSRLDDGRPGVDEAWTMLPRGEDESTVWTDEMAHAWGIARHASDKASQRAAFREAYLAAVAYARDQRKPANWTASLGWDAGLRDAALMLAVHRGRISMETAREFAPQLEAPSTDVMRLVASKLRRNG